MADVPNVMTAPGRDENGIMTLRLLCSSINIDLPLSLHNKENLVSVWMDFLAQMGIRPEAHCRQLTELSSIEDLTEMDVLLGRSYNVLIE